VVWGVSTKSPLHPKLKCILEADLWSMDEDKAEVVSFGSCRQINLKDIKNTKIEKDSSILGVSSRCA
jgi:hypothetical protein